MSYRSDEDAALARADALQHDLDESQHELEATRAKLAQAERERQRVEHPVPPPETPEPVAKPSPPDGNLAPVALVIFVFSVVAIAGLSFCSKYQAQTASRSSRVPNPICTLRTNPPGAHIFVSCKDAVAPAMNDEISRRMGSAASNFTFPTTFERDLGTTPMAKSRLSWTADRVTCSGAMVARLSGYIATPVDDPIDGTDCSEHTIQLSPEHVDPEIAPFLVR